MYLLCIIIVFFVYVILSDSIGDFLTVENKGKEQNRIKILDEKYINFNVYNIKKDAVVYHYPGKIMIKDNYNIFINNDSENKKKKKDKIYTLDFNFSIKIINLSGDNITDYYIEN